MEARYNPKEVESRLFEFWEKNALFVPSDNDKDKPSYTVLMPPPNVTNVLHLGHALNNTLQDTMIRYHRMQGYAAMWKIGVDHAGIATQNIVERELLKEGITREQIGREEFLKRVWEWKNKYGSNILGQLKRLGVSGDWQHDRFTMDEVSSQAVKEIFVKLYNDNLIYRGEYIINWCPHCLTTISDDEVEHVEYNGGLYLVKYQLEDESYVVVATTRPETILGDVALAVNPKDSRYASLVGKKAKVPIVDRWIPIIGDDSVEIEFGTGVLKVTPSHDPLDFEIGKRHGLSFLEVIDQHGKMNEVAGEHEGEDRFEFRKTFLIKLKEKGLLQETKSHSYARGTCYRCHNVIEPKVSTQWFVRMKPLAEPAKQVVAEGKIEFTPKKWEKVYFHWMNNIKDWSISRQLWWGHSIPAYYCQDCQHTIVSVDVPEICPKCGSKQLIADPDVLDTWFSSWIWPFTVFNASEYTKENWQTPELKRYYPTQYLATAPEIIFFWVARMIMAGMYLDKNIPFKQVFFNSTVCDLQGRKMSKSLGNGIDPIDVIEEHGADALRFTLLFIAPKVERIRIDKKSFDVGARLVTKIWNASRFIFSQKPEKFSINLSTPLEPKNLWESFILARYYETLKEAQKPIETFDYYTLTHSIYHFFWEDFCDWFIESQKIVLKTAKAEEYQRVYLFLETILDGILRLLHPIMPFITEEIWQHLTIKKEQALITASYSLQEDRIISSSRLSENSKIQEDVVIVRSLQKLISDLRSIKKEFGLSDKEQIQIYTEKIDSRSEFDIQDQMDIIKHFVNATSESQKEENATYILLTTEYYNVYLKLPANIDLQREKARLHKEFSFLELEIKRAENKLNNSEFLKKALPELISKEALKLQEFQDKKNRLENFLTSLGD